MNRKSFLAAVSTIVVALGFAAIAQAQASLDDILNRGTIRVGVLATVPPFGVYNDAGEVVGFDVDLANLLAENLGVDLEIVPIQATNRVPFLRTGRVDLVVGTFSRTVQREAAVDFSVPYAIAGPVVVTSADNEDITGIEDLAGVRVSVIPGIVGEIWARRLQPDANYVEFQNEADQLLALRQGQVTALVQDVTIASAYVEQYPDEVQIVGEPFYKDYLAIGIPQGQTELKGWVDWFVFQMHNLGEINTLWNEYFSYPEPEIEANPFF